MCTEHRTRQVRRQRAACKSVQCLSVDSSRLILAADCWPLLVSYVAYCLIISCFFLRNHEAAFLQQCLSVSPPIVAVAATSSAAFSSRRPPDRPSFVPPPASKLTPFFSKRSMVGDTDIHIAVSRTAVGIGNTQSANSSSTDDRWQVRLSNDGHGVAVAVGGKRAFGFCFMSTFWICNRCHRQLPLTHCKHLAVSQTHSLTQCHSLTAS